jgi:hypothetical protein
MMRQVMRTSGLIVGGLMGLMVIVPGAIAQELPNGNGSDNSGTTVTEPSIETRDEIESFLEQDVLDAAEQLSRELGKAKIACADSRVAALNLPRRFARGAATNAVCVSQECQTLRVVTQQARTFLQSLDQAQRDRLRQIQALQLW